MDQCVLEGREARQMRWAQNPTALPNTTTTLSDTLSEALLPTLYRRYEALLEDTELSRELALHFILLWRRIGYSNEKMIDAYISFHRNPPPTLLSLA